MVKILVTAAINKKLLKTSIGDDEYETNLVVVSKVITLLVECEKFKYDDFLWWIDEIVQDYMNDDSLLVEVINHTVL